MNTNDRLAKILNRAADVIEGACYNEGLPVSIGENDIVVLADQCRMYARPLLTRAAVKEWQVSNLGCEYPSYKFDNAFRDVSLIKTKAHSVIKGMTGLPANRDFGIDVGGSAIVFDFSLTDLAGEEYFHPLSINDEGMSQSRRNQLVIGKTLESEIVVINPEDVNHHHILIVGSTGSGKTVLANTLIGAVVSVYPPREMRLFISSGKEEDVVVWGDVPHLLYPPSHDSREVTAMLSWAKKERERRSHLPAKDKAELPHIVIYIGEISALLGGAGTSEMEMLLDDLLCMGRSSKIHLWVTTQRPTSKKVGSADAKGQFKLVMCGAMQNPQDAYIALGSGKSGAEFLPNRGAFITNNGTRFQAVFLGDDEHPEQIEELVSNARARLGEPEYIELDVSAVGDVESSNLTQDVLDMVDVIRANKITEIAKTYITTVMGWGYSRANRVWLELERVGAVLPRESKNVPAQLDLEAMEKEYGHGRS